MLLRPAGRATRCERAGAGSVRRPPTAGTPAARGERDAFVACTPGRLPQLRSVEERLCFGRLDLLGGERRYIGRIGLSDDGAPPAAGRLARAGGRAVLPGHRGCARTGVVRRRHLTTEGREVTGLDDEVFDLDAFDRRGTAPAVGRRGRAARRARRAPHRPDARHRRHDPGRAGRDHPGAAAPACWSCRAARAPARPRSRCTAPPTCSTRTAPARAQRRAGGRPEPGVPALHRAGAAVARRDRGACWPPSASCCPGVDASADETPRRPRSRATADGRGAGRGRARPAAVAARAGRACRRRARRGAAAGATCEPALERARRGGAPHNAGRVTFVKYLLGAAAGQARQAARRLDAEERGRARSPSCATSPGRPARAQLCWTPLSPERLLRDLFAEPGGWPRPAAAVRGGSGRC